MDPDSLNPGSINSSEPLYGSPIRFQGFDDQKLRENCVFFLTFFDQNCNFLMSKLQEKPSALKREHPALQKMN